MTAVRWFVQAVVWLISYLLVLTVYQIVERWLVARFQQRSTNTILRPFRKNWKTAIVLLVALLAGTAIPLSSEMTIGSWQLEYHLLGHTSVALLNVLIVQWLGEALWLFLDRHESSLLTWQTLATILVDALPTVLIVLGLLLTSRQNSLQLTTWIAAQDRWNGLWWMVWTQPLLSILWLICTRPHSWSHTSNTWAQSIFALNHALLTSALLFGGWQGPFVEQWPWLGLLYTTLKTIAVGAVWTWMRVTLPRANLTAHNRTVQQNWVPLIILNLIVTALLVVVS